jgi:protein-disulfide isomerase
MKAYVGSGIAALALMLTGCGGDNAAGNGAAAANNAPLTQIKAPNGDWTQQVVQTPEGGFLMGNPQAPVKVVEFGSMTCGHCATFAEEGEPKLIEAYVKSGQVSFEMRNFVRDPADLAAAIIARCNGPSAFFPLNDQLFAAQEEWLGALSNMSQQEQQQLQSLPPAQVSATLAQKAGLDEFARVRGIPAAKVQACLSDQTEIKRLVDMNQRAVKEHSIDGTPSFLVNGRLVEGSTWAVLEPEIRKALP